MSAALLLAFLAAAPAQIETLDDIRQRGCFYQWDTGILLRELPAAERARYAGAGLYYCRNPETKGVYLARLLEGTHKDEHGLCFFGDWRVAVESDGAGAYVLTKGQWIDYPGNTVRMQLHDGACPRQDDPGYVVNFGVPDGLFLELWNLWHAMLRSPKAFDDALASDVRGDPQVLRDELAAPGAADRLRLEEMSSGNGFFTLMGTRDAQTALPLNWSIDVGHGETPISVRLDWRDGTLKIVNVGVGKY